ncbi:hypothetical protein B6E66_23945 [Streptomyces maremycinicus]|nr:hypothetical protein B6E66_23945 [Streptomyces sp. B9173]
MTRMPVTTRCARALLVAVGLSGIAGSVRLAAAAAAFESGALGAPVVGLLLLAAAGCAALAVASLVVSARFADGGGAVRSGAVAVAWVTLLGGLAGALTHHVAWGAGAAVGASLVALSNAAATREWFGRARLLTV